MSLKSIEMQITVPRTNEAGKVHQDFQQRPLNDQNLLAGEQIRSSQAEAKRSAEVSESSETAVRDGGSRQAQDQQGDAGGGSKEQPAEQPAEHPYKGRNFDVSL